MDCGLCIAKKQGVIACTHMHIRTSEHLAYNSIISEDKYQGRIQDL